VLAEWSLFVQTWFDTNHRLIIAAIDDLEIYSFDDFICESAPSKRREYRMGLDTFLDRESVSTLLEAFPKSNELHYDKLDDCRVRQLFNPPPALKALSSMLARLSIRVLKKVIPGFISGYSESALAEKMTQVFEDKGIAPWSSFFGSGDFGNYDGHASPESIEIVDHYFMRTYFPLILQKTSVPDYLHRLVIRTLCKPVLRFKTRLGMTGQMCGTVFSGHGTRTTLFNTLRNVLMVQWAHCKIDPNAKSHINAGGDDSLTYFESPLSAMVPPLLGAAAGHFGLGQDLKDYIVGPLMEHTFLSKKFYQDGPDLVFHRLNSRMEQSGIARPLKSPLSVPEHAKSQFYCNLVVPAPQLPFRDRWLKYDLPSRNSKALTQFLNYDWAAKLACSKNLQNPELDYLLDYKDDQAPLIRVLGGRSTGLEIMLPNTQTTTSLRGNLPASRRGGRKALTSSALLKSKADENSYAFALGLFSPFAKLCCRVPSPFPIPSSTTTIKGSLTLNCNALGYGFAALNPWATSITQVGPPVVSLSVLSWDNTAAKNDASQWAITAMNVATGLTQAGTSPANFTKYRVVSCYLGGVDLTPAQTRTGTITTGCIPYSQITGGAGGPTADTLRDYDWMMQHSSSSIIDYRGGFYVPADISCFNFSNPNSVPSGEWLVPAFYCSGLVANATISFEYIVNYEFIPSTGFTDLLAVEPAEVGQFEQNLLGIAPVRDALNPVERTPADVMSRASALNSEIQSMRSRRSNRTFDDDGVISRYAPSQRSSARIPAAPILVMRAPRNLPPKNASIREYSRPASVRQQTQPLYVPYKVTAEDLQATRQRLVPVGTRKLKTPSARSRIASSNRQRGG
jgi:hypothetical protein